MTWVDDPHIFRSVYPDRQHSEMLQFAKKPQAGKEVKSVYSLDRLVALVSQRDGNEYQAEEQDVHYRVGDESMKDQENSIQLKLASQGIQKSENDVGCVQERQSRSQFVEASIHARRGTEKEKVAF